LKQHLKEEVKKPKKRSALDEDFSLEEVESAEEKARKLAEV